jgi:hypothetical protein
VFVGRPISKSHAKARSALEAMVRSPHVLGLAVAIVLVACAGARFGTEGIDVATVPTSLRADYEVFADRCSRCHTLARPLNSSFSTMNDWRNYVARMRRQPGSGITTDDEVQILRFLEYFNGHRDSMRAAESSR